MSTIKIAALVGASIITAGSTAAVATRSKWLPKGNTRTEGNNNISETEEVGAAGAKLENGKDGTAQPESVDAKLNPGTSGVGSP